MITKNNNNNNNNNNVGLTPDLSTRLMELFTDYHQAVTVWLSPACYTLVITYFSTIFAIYTWCEFSGIWRGAAEFSALLGYCALSPSVCCPNVQGRILHWTQKSDISIYTLIYENISLYLIPMHYSYRLLLCCVLITLSYSNIFTHHLNSLLCFRTVQHVIIFKPCA